MGAGTVNVNGPDESGIGEDECVGNPSCNRTWTFWRLVCLPKVAKIVGLISTRTFHLKIRSEITNFKRN